MGSQYEELSVKDVLILAASLGGLAANGAPYCKHYTTIVDDWEWVEMYECTKYGVSAYQRMSGSDGYVRVVWPHGQKELPAKALHQYKMKWDKAAEKFKLNF